MKIPLNLKKHCIKTEIKKIYEKTLSQCLRQHDDKDEILVQILKEILENNDLIFLRGKYPELSGGDIDISLVIKNNQEKYFEIDSTRSIVLK